MERTKREIKTERKSANIPIRFKLFGETVEVKWVEELNNKENANGMAHYRYSTIELQPSTEAIPRTNEQLEQSYLHEVTHFILDAIQEDKLRQDEKFIELFSKALHQVLTTSDYGTTRELSNK